MNLRAHASREGCQLLGRETVPPSPQRCKHERQGSKACPLARDTDREGERQLADDTTTPAGGKAELDAEGKQLQLQAEKAGYIEAIAKSQQAAAQAKTPSLSSLIPTAADVPKGDVTVGEKAGALGTWRAHRIVEEVANKIAREAKPKLLGNTGSYTPRVLVVDDRSLLEGDWTARQ